MQGLNVTDLPDGRRAIIIRTSDRIAFKSCRRKWGWSSHLKANLAPKQLAAPLWFGSAIHYALEDYHGWNKFGHPKEAFKAYCLATAKNYLRDLPPDAQEHYELGQLMMDYYVEFWLQGYPRKPDETYWAPNPQTGVMEPQVEVNFEIEVPIHEHPILLEYCKELGVDCVLYRGTIDRVVVDEWGSLWVDEYKTAKVFQNQHYQTDPQVTTYVWACGLIYDAPVAGVIYHQFIKKAPVPPRILASGKVSTASNLATSYPLYKRQLEAMYGDVMKAPSLNQDYMNTLMKSENQDRDRYIIRERIFRNSAQCQIEAQKILLELEDMLNPDLPLYPNPTRDCSRMCSFLTPCVNMDDGSDWEALLNMSYGSRDQDVERMWRRRLPSPEELLLLHTPGEEPDLQQIHYESLDAYKQAEIAAGEFPPDEFQLMKMDPYKGMDEKGSFDMDAVQSS